MVGEKTKFMARVDPGITMTIYKHVIFYLQTITILHNFLRGAVGVWVATAIISLSLSKTAQSETV